jgi:carbon-monoxide dehydrogenase large subunit
MRRIEDPELITGRGKFLADLVEPGTLHCAFVRSPEAHAWLGPLDLGEARGAPGVLAVFSAEDLDLKDIPGATGPGSEAPHMTRPPLARDKVRYVGEPLAVVVAETAAAARDAAELVWPELELLPPVVDAEAALAGETLLFPAAGTNVVARTNVSSGDSNREMDYPVRATVTVESPRLAPAPIEPLGILVRPADGGLWVWCGHQSPHQLRAQLGDLLGLDPQRIRVTVPHVGGAFGMKRLYPEYPVVAAVALRLARPVVWVQTRREQFLGGTHGRGQRHRIELAGDRDGRIKRARIEILAELGAYPHTGSQVPLFTQYVATGLYDIEDVLIETTTVVTNHAPTGPYRGAGRPEAALAIERAVDAFARAAGRDPAEVRFTNFIPPSALPYRTVTGALYDSGDYPAALRRALELADADGVRAEQARRRREGGRPLGLGIGAFVERAGGAIDSGEYARVEVSQEGKVIVRTGSTSAGQGHATVWTRVVCDVLTVAPESVRVVAGDTGAVADGVGSFASRSAQLGASAVHRMAIQVRERARRLCADMLEAAEEDLVLEQGAFRVAGVPGIAVPLEEVARRAEEAGDPLAAEETFAPGAQTFPYGAHVAVVEVETETGEVSVIRLVAVDDCGEVLDSMIVEGQVEGSLVQGIGQALLEEMVYDGQGQPLTSSFMDYLIPSAADAPPIITGRLVHPAPSNPLGVKGAGEAGCIGAPPAVLNAVLDALHPLGIEELQLPLRPLKIWQAIRQAARS